jgi:hypothetical protein
VRWLLLAAAVVMLPGGAAAQDAQEHAQPLQDLFFTEVVYPQQKHEVQLTLGSLVDRTRHDKSALAPFGVEYGLTNRWQIGGEWDGYSRFHDDPFANARTERFVVGTKYSWMNIGHAPVHAAAGLDVEFTRGGVFAEGEGEEGTQFEPFLALAADLPGGITVFGSGGLSLQKAQIVDLAHGAAPPDDQGTLGGGVLVKIARVTLATEYTNRSDQAPWRLNGSPLVTPSIVLHPGGEWEFGAGLPVGVRAGTHRPGLALHVIKEF